MQAFATRARLSTPALSRMLSGARTPGRDSIERIARASGRSPAWFYPPSSGYSIDLEFLRLDDPEIDAALRTLRRDPTRTSVLKRVFKAAALALAEPDLAATADAEKAVASPPAAAAATAPYPSRRPRGRPRGT
ncbi:MAG TPA: helix-turn-helix transcriptional regulator [Myxococcota bacterium]|nr:helix-turn-helix transcriptional regulator [Myxococcota bacterium]